MDRIPVSDLLARRSIRSYSDEPCTEAQIEILLRAAMAAPSACNRKPWGFVVVTNRAQLNRLAGAHEHGKMLEEAPLCIAVCGDMSRAMEGEGQAFWIQDCSAATENILLAAAGLGLGAVWLGVHPRTARKKAVGEVLGLPAHVELLSLIAVGHPAEEKEPRTQYDAALVHHERWPEEN